MRTVLLYAVLATTAATAAIAPAPAGAALTTQETLLLDTYSPLSKGFAGPVTTTETLAAGTFYAVETRGTFSGYLPKLMAGTKPSHKLCGTTEPEPMFPSPGQPPSAVGHDSEFVFARARFKECVKTGPHVSFQTDLGAGYFHPTANGAPYTAPAPGHRYIYVVEGRDAKASFIRIDPQTRDNNGILEIKVRPATLEDCAANAACLASLAGLGPAAPGTIGAVGSATSAADDSVISQSSKRTCASRRRFRIRLVTKKSDPIVSATVRVNGKTVKVLKAKLGGRLRDVSTVDLRGLPAGRITVSITARTKSGKIRRGTRRYFTCKPKLSGGKPTL